MSSPNNTRRRYPRRTRRPPLRLVVELDPNDESEYYRTIRAPVNFPELIESAEAEEEGDEAGSEPETMVSREEEEAVRQRSRRKAVTTMTLIIRMTTTMTMATPVSRRWMRRR